MTGVDTGQWLNAVDAHPDTLDSDLLVAVALANGTTEVDGMPSERVGDCVEELIALGFLEDVVSVDLGDGREEHVLELRLP